MSSKLKPLFLDAVRRAMADKEWNQGDLAIAVYGSAETKWRVAVSRTLKGTFDPSLETIERWCDALGLDLTFRKTREKISA